MTLTFFTKEECTLCDAAWYVVRRVCDGRDVTIERVDITDDGQERWQELYRDHIPVLHLNGKEIFRHRVHERKLREILDNAT